MKASDQVARALNNADWIAADPHMRDYRHSTMRMDVFVLGKQLGVLCEQHKLSTRNSAANAMTCVRNLDNFWTMYDVRHATLRAYLVTLAAELRYLNATAADRKAAIAASLTAA